MKKKYFSFFDEPEEAEQLVDSENEIEEELYYPDIWFWCKACKIEHRWTTCPKPAII